MENAENASEDARPDVACIAPLGRGGEVLTEAARKQAREYAASLSREALELAYVQACASRDSARRHVRGLIVERDATSAENEQLRTALADAIRRPMGVVPDSALPFVAA